MDQTRHEQYLSLIEVALESMLSKNALELHLRDAIHYSIFPRGKRIRPLFACAICADLGGAPTQWIQEFCALELIHNSSLIHDDLPALDNDEYRRGRLTTHKQFGEATALLAGDALIGLSYQIIAASNSDSNKKVKLVEALSNAFILLCNGQQLDVLPHESREEIRQIHLQKTGALFGASFLFGAIAASDEAEIHRAAYQLGEKFGLAFQMLDDFLDKFGDPHERGRPLGSDERNAKSTYFSTANMLDSLKEIEAFTSEFEIDIQKFARFTSTVSLPRTTPLIRSIIEPLQNRLSTA